MYKNLLLVLRVLEARIRTRKDSKAVNHASMEKQPRVEELLYAKTVTTKKAGILVCRQVTEFENRYLILFIINLLAFYHEYCSLIGYATLTIYSIVDSE